MAKKVAVVTGANRGIGWGTAQALAAEGYEVVLLGRNLKELEERVKELGGRDQRSEAVLLDLARPETIEEAGAELKRRFPDGIDVLVNNAGVFLEANKPYNAADVKETLQINTLGPLQLAEALGPLLKKRKGVLVNISSGMGQLSEMDGGSPGYRISKTALNAVTRYLAAEWKSTGVRVNSICPGWVKTDMGGEGAQRSVDEAVKGVLWAATLPAGGPSGGFFRDGKPIAW
jgi:NAD(P)-dependent dehydrogenase (short-subunit alcohol dehydrogenase family)